jgi:protein-tyrosine phosphatase
MHYRIEKTINALHCLYGKLICACPILFRGRSICLENKLKKLNPKNILFICQGNICRSAYAEAKLKKLAKANNRSDLNICSAGTRTDAGKPADKQAIISAKQRDIDLEHHKTTPLNASQLSHADLILYMENRHFRRAKKTLPQIHSKTFILGCFANNQELPLVITDPYGKNEEEFKKCFDHIDSCLESLLKMI